MPCYEAVSYTHLDVYKRQDLLRRRLLLHPKIYSVAYAAVGFPYAEYTVIVAGVRYIDIQAVAQYI